MRTRELGHPAGARRHATTSHDAGPSDSAVVVGGGVAAGIACALVLERFLQSLLFEVSADDPLSLAAVGAAALIIGLLSAYLPARRATRVDPLTALHDASA